MLGCASSYAQYDGLQDVTKWKSLFGATHKKIAVEALKKIDKNLYPDIAKAASLLKDGSASENGHPDFWHDNGGLPKDLWENGDAKNSGGVLGNYKTLNTETAYRNLGIICHLTQDMAVPAHAANIAHLMSEGMEEYADYDPTFGPVPAIDTSRQPYEYYQAMQDDTRSHLSSWRNPDTGIPYWVPSPSAPRFGQDATKGPGGAYGGGHDTYSSWIDDSAYGGQGNTNNRKLVARIPEICRDRLGMAAGYTMATLESASKKLPPLVKNFAVYPNVVTPGSKVDISFIALENRSRNVKCSITLTPIGGQPQTLLVGDIVLNDPTTAGYSSGPGGDSGNNTPSSVPENYLFNRSLSFSWNGLLSGKPPAEGSYLVEVLLTDEDGNTIPAEVNTDSMRENDSRAVLSVVKTLPPPPAPSSFDTNGG